MKTIAIIPSAGHGKRLGSRQKKPFVLLGSRPLVYYSLRTLEDCASIDGIIIAAERSCVARFRVLVKKCGFKKVVDVVVGGKTRSESVRNCLKRIGPSADIVLIHDAARPFIESYLIEKSIRAARKTGGCIVAVPESDTVKLVDSGLFIKDTLDRNRVFRAQTPQVFRRDLIQKAYGRLKHAKATDDAGLVEMAGGRVKVIMGSYRNIKITTKEDLKLAEVLLCGSE